MSLASRASTAVALEASQNPSGIVPRPSSTTPAEVVPLHLSRHRRPGPSGSRSPHPSESFIISAAMVPGMEVPKARFRRSEARRRETDVILEAVRRRTQTAEESLRALSAHNAAVLRMNRAKE